MRYSSAALLALLVLVQGHAHAQPRRQGDRIVFTYLDPRARTVSLVGDFNGWTRGEDPFARDSAGVWSVAKRLGPGMFQYKFVVDGEKYVNDPGNPATVENFNRSSRNSVFTVTDGGEVLLSATVPGSLANPRDVYPASGEKKQVYLNIIWHQHQPLYADPESDQLKGPWVRTHATKDYYDMAAMLRNYPDIHCTINLTSSLLLQLQEYYVARLGPFVDAKANSIDVEGFWKKYRGKTDPWIDLALKPAEEFTRSDRDLLYRNAWNAFGISEVMIERFPEYRALHTKLAQHPELPEDLFSVQEQRELKFWFYLAHFDPDFLLGPVVLPDRSVCDISDYLRGDAGGKFRLRRTVTEADCRRIVVEAYKVMASVVPVHRELQFDPESRAGQVEIITTPYYHPILPLIYDSDLARTCQPADTLPARFSYPGDADAQVAKAVVFFRDLFGRAPTGMWPGEGSVAQPVLPVLRTHGIRWTASDVKVLARSAPQGQPSTAAYQFPAGDAPIAMVFRDTELSDRIGFKYQSYQGEEAAEDFVRSILALAPRRTEPDRLVTVILDGENAWEWYRHDMDAKKFLNALYRKLSALHQQKKIITTTTVEYLEGNPGRGIPAHPVESLPKMTWLWPGSWINGNYDTWIGEGEENKAWEYLLATRRDLEKSGIARPDPASRPPRQDSREWYAYKAWESMYAAEGSDWFWWYGADQSAPGSEEPFDAGFRTHLANVYRFAGQAGAKMQSPVFAPIVIGRPPGSGSGGEGAGAMARGDAPLRRVIFTCDATSLAEPRRVFVAGNIDQLGSWRPNVVQLHDDGTHGDRSASDGIWSLEIDVAVGTEVMYKYTNNGTPGVWIPGEEFPARHRVVRVSAGDTPLVIRDVFGQ